MLEPLALNCTDPLRRPRVAEFFAGIGLARIGLEKSGFEIGWSNDCDTSKGRMYQSHFGADASTFVLADIAGVSGSDLPQNIDLAWASFPCTDLSLAGDRRGLDGKQSGTFHQFSRVLDELGKNRPPVVVLENVQGLVTSHGGQDMTALVRRLNSLNYSVDVVLIDARHFVPQSRPRLFIIGSTIVPAQDTLTFSELRPPWLQDLYNDTTLRTHRALLPRLPQARISGLHEIVESISTIDPRWWDANRTSAFYLSLSEIQRHRLDGFRQAETISFRTAYRRTRSGRPTWEIRSDEIAGCLRTARGGSSKQSVVMAGRGQLKVRWMTALEYARLMGAGDYSFEGLPMNSVLSGFGDAVCVDAVRWLGDYYLRPLFS